MLKHIYLKFKYLYRIINPIIDVKKLLFGVPYYISFLNDLFKYRRLNNSEQIKIKNLYPCIYDKTSSTPIDSHYFYQDIWAFKKILTSQINEHVDVGSRSIFVGMASCVTKITFIDIRPLLVNLENFENKKGSIIQMPFCDDSINSLSCLHVAEHVGLGRYGDSLDPNGTIKSAKELSRVLAKGGNLYFSVPIGKPRLCYNAHRIHSPQQILEMFNELNLVEFSVVDDNRNFIQNANYNDYSESNYACGMFWFRK